MTLGRLRQRRLCPSSHHRAGTSSSEPGGRREGAGVGVRTGPDSRSLRAESPERGGHGGGHRSFFDQVVDPVDEILKLYPPARVREPLNKDPVLDAVENPLQRIAHVLEHPYRVSGARPVHPHWQGSLGRGHSLVHRGQGRCPDLVRNGVPRLSPGAYERGDRVISVLCLQRLAELYQVPVDHLLPNSGESSIRWNLFRRPGNQA